MSGILKKPLHEVHEKDHLKFEKKIGERYDFPMMGLGYVVSDDGKKTISRYLGVLDKPLIVSSDRTLDEVEGTLLRDTPTPDMLPMFFNVMSAVHPRNARRAMMLIGAPGAGKTFLGEMVGRVMSDAGPITIDCTGLNLNELFYETVLDFNSNQNFYKSIDAKLAQYNEATGNPEAQERALNSASIEALREGLGEAFHEDKDGHVSIDWKEVKRGHREDPNDPESAFLTSAECSARAKSALEWVGKMEGLEGGSNTLGMSTQEGPAWQAYKEGRVLVLDEMNRAKKGTHGVIHGWMQFVIGEKDHYTFRNPMQEKGDESAKSMTFRKSEMGAGHFVFMTGNTVQDSDEVFELPEALSSRIVEERVPDATELSWQHRICQILTGVPISTHFQAQRDRWSKDPEGFGKFVMEARLLGEKKDVPDFQLDMLRRWDEVLQASENLAKFFFHAAEIVNPDSDKYKLVKDLNQLLDEIDESFKKETSVDFRKISYFLNRAFMPKPVVRPPDDEQGARITPLLSSFDMPDDPSKIEQKLGTHMSYAILDWIVNKTYEQGKHALGNQLMQLASDCGVVEAQLSEAKASKRKSIITLLDDEPFDSQYRDKRMSWTRDIAVDYLRDTYTDAKFPDDNDEILPASIIDRAVAEIEAKDAALPEGAPIEDLALLHTDMDHFESQPFKLTKVYDAAAQMLKGESANIPAPEELATQESFLRSLSIPDLRDRNLEAIWNTNFSESGVVANTLEDVVDHALAIAENTSDSGLSATTVMARTIDGDGKSKPTPMHVVWNKNQDKLLVVGEGQISGSLKSAFNSSRVIYVDRMHNDAVMQVKKGLAEIVGAENYGFRADLKNALLMRTSVSGSAEEDFEQSLDTVLASKNTVSYLPKYIMAPS